jgi:hypothetical protein
MQTEVNSYLELETKLQQNHPGVSKKGALTYLVRDQPETEQALAAAVHYLKPAIYT